MMIVAFFVCVPVAKASARVGAELGPILLVTTPDVSSWIYTEIEKQCTDIVAVYEDGEIKQTPKDTSYSDSVKVVRWATDGHCSQPYLCRNRSRQVRSGRIGRVHVAADRPSSDGKVRENGNDSARPARRSPRKFAHRSKITSRSTDADFCRFVAERLASALACSRFCSGISGKRDNCRDCEGERSSLTRQSTGNRSDLLQVCHHL